MDDHARANRVERRLIDEDEAAGRARQVIRIEQQRCARAQVDSADLVEAQAAGRLIAVERVDVDAVAQVVDDRLDRAGGVLTASG